jgi:hypothetical protein
LRAALGWKSPLVEAVGHEAGEHCHHVARVGAQQRGHPACGRLTAVGGREQRSGVAGRLQGFGDFRVDLQRLDVRAPGQL